MTKIIKQITGKVQYDVFGSWEDCSPGLYIDYEKVCNLFSDYEGKKLRVTIEEIDDDESEE